MNAPRPLLFALLLAIMGGMPLTGMAQETSRSLASNDSAMSLMLKQQQRTHPERILLAFHKLANIPPDFNEWAALSPFLDKASDSDVPAIINRETNRLSRAYTEFKTDELLNIQTTVQLDDYSTINGVLHLSEFSPATFFTFSLYGENIAVVPKGIATFGDIPIAKAKMDEMLSNAKGSNVTAELMLKPVVADARNPFVHHDTKYQLMLAEIAEIRLWTTAMPPVLLWTYRADWYEPKLDQSLMDLKGGRGLIP